MAPGLGDVLVTSVKAEDRAWAEAALPGARLEERSFGREMAQRHADARLLCVMVHDRLTPEALAAMPALEGVVTRSAGFDHLPLAWLGGRGVPAYALGGYSTASVAHLAVGFIVMLLYRVPEAMARTQGSFRGGREASWSRAELVGRHVGEVTVGVVGVGRIGGEVVRLLSAMGARTVGFDIAPNPALAGVAGFRFADSLAEVLGQADVLSLHVPLTDRTRGMVDAAALARLPAGALLVNTARGAVVDQAAVAEALGRGRLAGYAADILPGEPTPPDLVRFQEQQRVVLTPHVAAYNGHTIRARYATTRRIVEAVLEARLDDVAGLRVA